MYPPAQFSFLVGPSPRQLVPASPVYTCAMTDQAQVRVASPSRTDMQQQQCKGNAGKRPHVSASAVGGMTSWDLAPLMCTCRCLR
jgi:hypothetical protein